MSKRDTDLETYARARLAYLTAGRQPVATGPRRGAPQPRSLEPGGGTGWDELDDDGEPATGLPRESAAAADRASNLVGFARGHLRAVALVLLVACLLLGGWLMRSRASALPISATPAAMVSGSSLPSTITTGSRASSTPAASATPAMLEVHVLGAVRRPGVVRLAAGARVQDALTAAGGLTATARPGELNLAAPLADGDQVVIGDATSPRGEVRHAGQAGTPDATGAASAAVATSSTGQGSTATVAQVDLNTATVEQLDQLPGVGPVTAQRILAFRSQHQRFSSVQELQEVDGIGPKTYAQIAPHVRV